MRVWPAATETIHFNIECNFKKPYILVYAELFVLFLYTLPIKCESYKKKIGFGPILVLGSAPSFGAGEKVPAVLRSPTPLHWLRLLLAGGHAGPRAGPLHPVYQDGLRCQLQTAGTAGASVQTSVAQNRICEAWGHQTLSLLILSFKSKDWATTAWTKLRWVWESLQVGLMP